LYVKEETPRYRESLEFSKTDRLKVKSNIFKNIYVYILEIYSKIKYEGGLLPFTSKSPSFRLGLEDLKMKNVPYKTIVLPVIWY
jgi:hypothetical protein